MRRNTFWTAVALYAALSVFSYFVLEMSGQYAQWMFYLSLFGGPTSALLLAHDFQSGSAWAFFPSPHLQYLALTLLLAVVVLLAWKTKRYWLRYPIVGIYWMLAGAINTYFNAMTSM